MPERSDLRLGDLLTATARELVESLEADGCTVSRVIGDLLILVAEHSRDGKPLILGQGYLVPDYPLTQTVLSSGSPHALTLSDDDVDPAEANVLLELGFASLLMLTLTIADVTWGLVEVYRREPRPFADADLRVAGEILARTSALVG